MPVGLDDAIDVGLDGGALQRAARLGFDGCREIGVLDLLVAFEGHAVQHGRLGDTDDQLSGAAVDRNLVEQSRRDQRLQRSVARGFVELSVSTGLEMRAHGFSIDPEIALDGDHFARRRGGFGRDPRDDHSPSAAASKPPAARRRCGRKICTLCLLFTSLPDSHLTGCYRIARAGQKNVCREVSCGPACHNLTAKLDPPFLRIVAMAASCSTIEKSLGTLALQACLRQCARSILCVTQLSQPQRSC